MLNYKDLITEDPETHGAFFCPIILGNDKTTVSVATGHNEYWTVYLSIRNLHNNIWWENCNGLVLLGFLAILKSKFFLEFQFFISIEVVCYPDRHFQRVVYGLGPYIADYPEQALLSCIVQGWYPR